MLWYKCLQPFYKRSVSSHRNKVNELLELVLITLHYNQLLM